MQTNPIVIFFPLYMDIVKVLTPWYHGGGEAKCGGQETAGKIHSEWVRAILNGSFP